MDKLATYRKYIQQLIEQYATYGTPTDDIEREMIIDTTHDHYQVMNVGWRGEHRIYGCVLHFDIKHGKIWIQQNGTEIDVAEELLQLGVARDDIVLGFQSPYKRAYTGFASQ
jgi:hypothetical protein